MHLLHRLNIRNASWLAAGLLLFAAQAGALTLTLRSGNAPAGNPDPLVRQLDLATSCGVGYATAFGTPEFTAAAPPAVVLSFVHPAWIPHLACDPLALWIGTTANANPISALYGLEFTVPAPCCIAHATLDICWSSDDTLGDAINPAGLYVNQTPIATVTGGNFTVESSVTGIDVTSLVHCGANTLHFYNRDIACAVSGLIFSATLHIEECSVPVTPSTWSHVKTIYN